MQSLFPQKHRQGDIVLSRDSGGTPFCEVRCSLILRLRLPPGGLQGGPLTQDWGLRDRLFQRMIPDNLDNQSTATEQTDAEAGMTHTDVGNIFRKPGGPNLPRVILQSQDTSAVHGCSPAVLQPAPLHVSAKCRAVTAGTPDHLIGLEQSVGNVLKANRVIVVVRELVRELLSVSTQLLS
ncbi:hypothetical protein NQZ68_018778 [Dissostichus eleginoides]|nr:hypothetical protein NQZ68_018778 [Dissostichus eleginoides]